MRQYAAGILVVRERSTADRLHVLEVYCAPHRRLRIIELLAGADELDIAQPAMNIGMKP